MKNDRAAPLSRRPPGMTFILVSMVVSFVGCVLLVALALFLTRYQRAITESAKTSSAQAVAQATDTVSSYITDMNSVMELLIATMDESEADRADFFAAFLKTRPDVIAVTSYGADGTLQDCWALGHTPRQTILENLSFDPALAGTAARYVSAPHVESIFAQYYPWVVTMAARLDGGGRTRWIALDLSFSGISSYVSNVGIGQHGYCFIMDEKGGIVYHPQQQLIYSGLKSEDTARLAALADGTYADDNTIYSLQTVPDSGWRVVGVSYTAELVTSNVHTVLRLLLLAAAGIIAVTLLSSWIVSRVLTRPLQGLAGAMTRFESDAGHFTYTPVRGSREVTALSDSFAHMAGQVQQLMATVREEETNLRKTELKALQAQINPHFLYNTLDSIAWMCEQKRSEDAVQMVQALATLFRISISRGRELIPVSREIEHAKSYLRIQQYRYKNQFTYSFDVDPSCEAFLCNKITLQPIIENAIYHGLDLLVDEGRIDITVRPDGGDILFTVADNGVGMPPEQAAAMLTREPSDRTGIGIKNVNDRLRIYFGEKYGLTIHSVPDGGTTVVIRMPQVREGEYDAK